MDYQAQSLHYIYKETVTQKDIGDLQKVVWLGELDQNLGLQS